jgi:hypothetical protein
MKGLFTAAILIGIALVCLSYTRRLERERRILAKLRKWGANEPGWSVALSELTPDERDGAASLVTAGVLEVRQGQVRIRTAEARMFRQKRTRLMVVGGFGAFLLAVLVAVLILRR